MTRQSTHAFLEQAERFKRWSHIALKEWHETAADPRGGFAEYRHLDGTADFNAVRRVRVQFRLAYVYALAGELGWYEHAKAASDHAWDFAISKGCPGGTDQGCAHLVKGNGALHDPFRDTYAQAFVILAGAWRYCAFQDAGSLNAAKAIITFLDTMLASPFGGWEEGWPVPKTPRRQNPHMHLFEAFLALYEATHDTQYAKYITRIKSLFDQYFFDPKTGLLFEYFENDWALHNDGGPIEPGHQMEWAWLLGEYERLLHKEESKSIDPLMQKGLGLGYHPDIGFLVDHCAADGSRKAGSYRSWPQTELIKACVSRAMAGDLSQLPLITLTIQRMFETYFNADTPGGWHDALGENGQIIQGHMQASTFYHIICAAAEVDKLAQKLNAQSALPA